VASGVCVDRVCAVIVDCGNGEVDVDLGEVCDDGNQVSGDGCSADCRSDETCGNGYVDFVVGERCDAGNLGGGTCASLGYSGGGTVACDVYCQFDESDCDSICGNDEREPDEACDGVDLEGETCESLSLGAGVLECRSDCRHFDTSGCDIQAVCGNGSIEFPEVCDGNNVGGMTCEVRTAPNSTRRVVEARAETDRSMVQRFAMERALAATAARLGGITRAV